MTAIEKAAKLMGIEEYKVINVHLYPVKDMRRPFNPLTNKSDLMDLECTLGIDVEWNFNSPESIEAQYCLDDNYFLSVHKLADYHDKFTARAHAVFAVAVQIYDRTNP